MHNIQFTLKEENESDKIFEGTIDDGKVHMKGKWKYKDSDEEQDFEFRLIDKIKGRMKLDPRFWPKIAERIELDMMTMKISNITSDDQLDQSVAGNSARPAQNVEAFYSINHNVQMADICFFIQHRDVNFLTTVEGEDEIAYVQGKLKLSSDDNSDRNDLGVAQSSIRLYNVSEKVKESYSFSN